MTLWRNSADASPERVKDVGSNPAKVSNIMKQAAWKDTLIIDAETWNVNAVFASGRITQRRMMDPIPLQGSAIFPEKCWHVVVQQVGVESDLTSDIHMLLPLKPTHLQWVGGSDLVFLFHLFYI